MLHTASTLPPPPEAPSVDDAVVTRIARAADVDRRTVLRRLVGLPVRGKPGARVDREIERWRLEDRDR